ncbi:eCIS core domain-containing protein [Streptomyces sp. NPDC054932]
MPQKNRERRESDVSGPGPSAARTRRADLSAALTAAVGGSGPLPPDTVLRLQRTVGNAAVARMLAERARHAASEGAAAPAAQDAVVQRSAVHQVLRSPGRPLDRSLRQEMEARLGADFSNVRLHNDSTAQRSAAEIGASAYTSGHHIVAGTPSLDQHTLAHELTHVIQQRRGAVAGTDNGAGLSVSHPDDRFEREAEANATRVMSAPRPVEAGFPADAGASHEGHAHTRTHTDTHTHEHPRTSAVQRRTATPLAEQLGAAEVADDVRKEIETYDGLKDSQLTLQQRTLETIQQLLPAGAGPVRELVSKELAHVGAELDFLRQASTTDEGPYELMTRQGLLWSEESFPMNTGAVGKTGKAYFDELSTLNLEGLQKENAELADPWYESMRGDLEQTLRRFVVRHYTPKERVESMIGEGMKSKARIEADSGGEHNTQPYDDHVLANTGFVFFYLEAPGDGFRESRFGNARITLGLEESGLLSKGWVMLTDFYTRDFPHLMVKRTDPTDVTSFTKSKREFLKDKPEFKDQLRTFKRDSGVVPETSERAAEMSMERRTQLAHARQQVQDERNARQEYRRGPNRAERPELLQQNVLVGGDIVPGLVERALAEVARISEVDPKTGEFLRAKNAEGLLRFVLKDVIRPQAMVPNSVRIAEEHVQYKN